MTKPVELKSFTSDMFKNFDYPIIEVKTSGIIKQILMLPLTQRDDYFNYSSGNGQSIVYSGQFIAKTNGFEAHLLSFETKELDSMIDKSPKAGQKK